MSQASAAAQKKPAVDTRREIVETVVVVLALVSLLRMFVAEAFSIPTGSMGPTLLGANRRISCPQCDYVTIAGAYTQAAGGDRIAGTICQNCRYPIFTEPRALNALLGEFGDRVIVSKYGFEFGEPKRWDVVVFIYPAEAIPEQNSYPSRTNFIKRLVGLPGEEVVFMYGDAYVRKQGAKDFAIAAKPPDVMLSTRRLVFDNDAQPRDLIKINYPARWTPTDGGGAAISPDRTALTINGDGAVEYRHLLGGGHRDVLPRSMPKATSLTPQLVTDFESYNRPYGAQPRAQVEAFDDLHYIDAPDARAPDGASINWIGDLMLECRLDLQQLQGTFNLHLTEATRQYRCELSFDGEKKIRLFQGDVQLAEIDNPVTAPGKVDIRFANFDDRLVVWIDDRTVFGDGIPVEVLTPDRNGPTTDDLLPAKLSFTRILGEVRDLKLYRDIYYTQESRHPDEPGTTYPIGADDEGSIATWRMGLQQTMNRQLQLMRGGEVRHTDRFYEVPTGHFMMCGDNSPRSFDGRGWNLTHYVPRQCVLGKALVVYYPLNLMFWKLKLIQ